MTYWIVGAFRRQEACRKTFGNQRLSWYAEAQHCIICCYLYLRIAGWQKCGVLHPSSLRILACFSAVSLCKLLREGAQLILKWTHMSTVQQSRFPLQTTGPSKDAPSMATKQGNTLYKRYVLKMNPDKLPLQSRQPPAACTTRPA